MKKTAVVLGLSLFIIIGVCGFSTYVALSPISPPSSSFSDKKDTSVLHESELDETILILFIGNSLTYSGDVPGQVQALSKMYGLDVKYENILWPSATLDELKEDAIREMQKKKYDYVVLQDRSYRPATEFQNFLEDVRVLCDESKKTEAIPVLYNPSWKVYNPEFADTIFVDENGKDIEAGEEYQRQYTEAYELAAQENEAILVNAGDAWVYAYKKIPGISLYEEDGHHPNDAGAYLTACVFVSTLFDLHIKDISTSNRYKDDDALTLGQAAWEFVSYYKENGKSLDE